MVVNNRSNVKWEWNALDNGSPYDCRLCVISRASVYSECKQDCESVPQDLTDIKSFKSLTRRDVAVYRFVNGSVSRVTFTSLLETNPKLKPYIIPYLSGKRSRKLWSVS